MVVRVSALQNIHNSRLAMNTPNAQLISARERSTGAGVIFVAVAAQNVICNALVAFSSLRIQYDEQNVKT